MENLYKDVGKRIQLKRSVQGYTREGLAELVDISTKYLYEIEKGKKGFSVWILYKLCQVLQVDCDYLLTGKQDNMQE